MTRPLRSLAAFVMLLSLAGPARPAAALELKFKPLDVGHSNPSGTSAYDINNDGVIAGNYTAGIDRFGFQVVDGFLYDDGVAIDVTFPGGGGSPNPPFGANYAGQITTLLDDGTGVGLDADATGKNHGFVRDPRGHLTLLPDHPDHYKIVGYFGLNSQGTVAGFYDAKGNLALADFHGFLLHRGVYHTVDVPGASGTQIFRINDEGQLIGLWFDKSGNSHGFFFDGRKYITIDYPGAAETSAFDVSRKGTVVGYYTDQQGVDHSFLWRKGAFVGTFDYPGANGTEALGINDHGDIVGTYDGFNRGFVAHVIEKEGEGE